MGKWVVVLKQLKYGEEWDVRAVYGTYPTEEKAQGEGPWLVEINKQREEVWDYDVFRLTK